MTLRGKVTELIYQEVWGLLLAYNIIRREACQTAVAFGRLPFDIRFKPVARYIAVQLIVMAAANRFSNRTTIVGVEGGNRCCFRITVQGHQDQGR